jgi:hypothetical protein
VIRLALAPQGREVLRSFAQQVVDLLDADPAGTTRRLFPPAYAQADDAEHEDEYRRLMGEDLRQRHREAAQTLLATLDNDVLSPEEAETWLRALNELRLVLGTVLDVSEEDDGPDDPDDPRAPGYALYHYLTAVQGELIEELAAAL